MTIGIRSKVTIDTARLEARLRGIAEAHGLKAEVGVLSKDANLPHEGGVTVGDVARYNEFGTDRIPARPFMRRARANAQATMRRIMAEGLRLGKPAHEVLGSAAAELADETVRQIDNSSSWAEPNSPNTIKRKGHDKPLTDTHLLRESQSWEVKNKEGRVLGQGRPAR